MSVLETLFFLPEWFDTTMLIKTAILGLVIWLIYWLTTIFLLNTVYRTTKFPRDLDIARARFWSIFWTLVTLQFFSLLALNWAVSEEGKEILGEGAFYVRIAPELVFSVFLLIALFMVRSAIQASVKLED